MLNISFWRIAFCPGCCFSLACRSDPGIWTADVLHSISYSTNIEKEKENWNRRPKFNLITPPRRGHRNKERFRERKKKREQAPKIYVHISCLLGQCAFISYRYIYIFAVSLFLWSLLSISIGRLRTNMSQCLVSYVTIPLPLTASFCSVLWPFLTSTVLRFYNPDWSVRHIVSDKSTKPKTYSNIW